MKDSLGDRMKGNYENRTKHFLPRRTYTIIRLDGKAFHTFTRGFNKPVDYDLQYIMTQTTLELAKNIQGCKLGYTQSDEISLLLTDFDNLQTSAFFDGSIQKICSVTASFATLFFREATMEISQATGGIDEKFYSGDKLKRAFFDSRCFTIAEKAEVKNYFLWRQRDAQRNAISMYAQSLYSHKQLHGKKSAEMIEMIKAKTGEEWKDVDPGFRNGRAIYKDEQGVWSYTAVDDFLDDEFAFLESIIP